MEYTYQTYGVCAPIIKFKINGNVITDIEFFGGCNGNLKAIAKLVDGWTVEEIEAKLRGNICGNKGTSCADQLAIAVRKAYDTLSK